MEKLINNYPAYPIYRFTFRWSEDGVQNEEYPNSYEGLPKGRVWNSVSFSKIYREDKTQDLLDGYINDFWEKIKDDKKGKIVNPELVEGKAVFVEYETWVGGWFQHETFDVGLTDDDVLASFEEFVYRKEKLGEDVYCLMGAEDRWRWRGMDENNGETSAPCRCKHCKEQNMVRIIH